MLVAIDPGLKQSGWVKIEADGRISYSEVLHNETVLLYLKNLSVGFQVVIEMMSPYGISGRSTYGTLVWIGQFKQVALARFLPVTLIERQDVKKHLCGTLRARDSNVWQAVVDRYNGPGGAIGTKKDPGPLYGVRSHCRQAVALAVAYLDGVRSKEAVA